ncbi:3D domain-containing protein [Psychrobacillus sp. FJAT-51614]|uniref:3D domain-containing protein n=1 Tax=Psychrobacillus mangrovi TaxID=3117745 RepID=A0ABU8F4T6_9BACI
MKLKVILFTLILIFSFVSVSYASEPFGIGTKNAIDRFEIMKEHFKVDYDTYGDSKDIPEPIVYIVEAGDNLYEIAIEHSVPLNALKEWNNLTDHTIHPRDELIINNKQSANFTKSPLAEDEMLVIATAYTAYCYGCSGTTAYGIDLRSNPEEKVIAVDPSIIPLGTKVWVEGYGEAIAGDTGGAIKGNRIDVFIPSYDHAIEWGVKEIKLKIID